MKPVSQTPANGPRAALRRTQAAQGRETVNITFLPIVERELRELSRKRLTYMSRMLTALLAVLISLGSIAVGIGTGSSPQQLGGHLFMAVSLAAFALVLPAGLILAADCLSSEKRLGTLGLLFLTNLRGPDIVAGKLVALAMPAVHCLLAIFPILGICFFMSGVTGAEFLRTVIVLSVTLFFSLGTAILASAICREALLAIGGAVMLMVTPMVLLPLGGSWLAHAAPGGGSIFGLLSPWQALQLGSDAAYLAHPTFYWATVVLSLAWGAACLALAGILLPRTWQDDPVRRGFLLLAGKIKIERPQSEKEIAERQRMLDHDPMLWLGQRNRWRRRGVWAFLAIATALMAFAARGPAVKQSWAVAIFLVVHFLQAGLKVWMAWEASRRFAEDRENGALELLLCTPMPEKWVWRGWAAHLKRQFLAPVVVLVMLDAIVLRAGLKTHTWWGGDSQWGITFLAGMGLFVSDMVALSWVGLWNGLTARNATRASMKTILQILVLPAAGCLGVLGFMSVVFDAQAPLSAMTALWFASGYIIDAAAMSRCMTRLDREFRPASIYGLAPSQHRTGWRGPDGSDGPGAAAELAPQPG